MMTFYGCVSMSCRLRFLFVLLSLCSLSSPFSEAKRSATLTPMDHQELLIGYTLLSNTLRDESKLWYLQLLKKLTFRATAREISETMDSIANSASARKAELARLRKLPPDVTGTPEKISAIGDAITVAAKEAGTGEMLSTSTEFNLRFMVLQAQATRMVAAMATALAKLDCNAERQEWLTQVSDEYEGYRDDIIETIRKYVRGQGAEQINPSWGFRKYWNDRLE